MQPNIGIIGAGAIGGFYGAMLVRAGFEVHFLLRSDYEHVAENGLTVRSKVNGNLRLLNVDAHQSAAAMPKGDWLLIGTKATSNVNLAATIIQTAATGAKVIVLQNGLGIEDKLRPLFARPPPSDRRIMLCMPAAYRARRDRPHRCWARALQLSFRSCQESGSDM
jgi:2-dehydropantoate 2-reductase